MTIFHWNPVRRNLSDARSRMELSAVPSTFIPKNYVRQRKHSLYNNLLVLLAGLSALTISHDMDIPDAESRAKLKNVLASGGLFVGHLVTVPFIIGKLHLHYSIVLGAMGMGVVPFLYYVANPIILSFVVCLRVVFVALFDVSAMTYIVRLARVCSGIQGRALGGELLTMRCLITIFSCATSVVSMAWLRYTQEPGMINEYRDCGSNFCLTAKSPKRLRLFSTLSTGLSTIFVAVAIVISLSGVILIAMYLKPITSLGSEELAGEPRASNPMGILRQFEKPKTFCLAILIASCGLMHGKTEEFLLAYVTCGHSGDHFSVACMKQVSVMFGVLTCATLVDVAGLRWAYTAALCGQFMSYVYLALGHRADFDNEITYMLVYHLLCTSVSVETSVLQLLVVQTVGDEEVSAWCLYYLVGDVVYLLSLVSDVHLCTGAKLWILIGVSPIAVAAISTYWHGFDENLARVKLNESCSQLIKTPTVTLTRESSFDLNILVERPEDIRRVETMLRREYRLKSRPIAVGAIWVYLYGFDENLASVKLKRSCSLLIKTKTDTPRRESSFDLKILVEPPEDIRSV